MLTPFSKRVGWGCNDTPFVDTTFRVIDIFLLQFRLNVLRLLLLNVDTPPLFLVEWQKLAEVESRRAAYLPGKGTGGRRRDECVTIDCEQVRIGQELSKQFFKNFPTLRTRV